MMLAAVRSFLLSMRASRSPSKRVEKPRSGISNWKEETKDKLRWLRGDEEDAKKIFGLFKRFPKIGNIRDTTGRKGFRLNQLPQV